MIVQGVEPTKFTDEEVMEWLTDRVAEELRGATICVHNHEHAVRKMFIEDYSYYLATVDLITRLTAARDFAQFERTEAMEQLDRYRWKPISEAHEDYGECIFIDVTDPGNHCLAHVCDLDYSRKIQGMTHFAQTALLTNEMVEELLIANKEEEKK